MEENDELNKVPGEQIDSSQDALTKVTGMYKDWFLDYASYVILERAVPAIEDGFKPVQRRIMHSLKDLDDGRYNKVANVVGHTMQYHPHGANWSERPSHRYPRKLGEYTDRRSSGGIQIY